MNCDDIWEEMMLAVSNSLSAEPHRKIKHSSGGAGVIIRNGQVFSEYLLKTKKAYSTVNGCYVPVPLMSEDYFRNKVAADYMLRVLESYNIKSIREAYRL